MATSIGPFKAKADYRLAVEAGAWDITGLDADLIHTTAPVCGPGGIYEGAVVSFDTQGGRQFAVCTQEFATQALRNTALFAQWDTAGLLCNSTRDDDFDLTDWFLDSPDAWFHTGTGVGSCTTWYVTVSSMTSPFRVRWQFFQGGGSSWPNTISYWETERGWQTTDDIYYNI
jgi:hypothetical protein